MAKRLPNSRKWLDICTALIILKDRKRNDSFTINSHMVIKGSIKGLIEQSNVERTPRQERAIRILDAATELLLRWGYKKTTIDDIAKQARVAKGTVYLHWKTREALFSTLIMRESITATRETLEGILNSPMDDPFYTLTKQSIYVLLKRPIIRALLLGDTDLLGDLKDIAVAGSDSTIAQQKLIQIEGLIQLLRNKKAIRTDMELHEQIYAISSIQFGFLTIDRYMPEGYHRTPEETAHLAAETVHRAFAPAEPIHPAAVEEITAMIRQVYDTLLKMAQDYYDKEMS